MRMDQPGFLALTISLVLGCIVFVIGISLGLWINKDLHWQEILLFSIITVFIAYLLFRFAVHQFIYSKVKIIYKNIHDLKVGI